MERQVVLLSLLSVASVGDCSDCTLPRRAKMGTVLKK